jgi:hypothetical protein
MVSCFLIRFESIKFVLPTGFWPEGSKSSGVVATFKPLDRLDGTTFYQYKMEKLYRNESATLLHYQLARDWLWWSL